MRIRLVLYFLFGLFFIVGCKSKQGGQEGGKLKKRSSKYLLENLDKYNFDAEWMNIKGGIKLKQNGSTTSASVYLRMRKDSVIWGAVKKIGFEAGRVLITTDSVFLVNRLNKTYLAEPISYIRNMMGMPQGDSPLSDFRNLYDLLLGNPIYLSEGKYDVDIIPPHYQLSKNMDGLDTRYWLNGQDFSLHKMEFEQKAHQRKASCQQEGYKNLDNDLLFSYIRNLDLYSPETGALGIQLNFSKVTRNKPTSIRFEIPSSYKKTR